MNLHMRRLRPLLPFFIAVSVCPAVLADDKTEVFDFQKDEVKDLPTAFMEIEGSFAIAEEGDDKFLRLKEEPLGENGLIFGASSAGKTILEARIRSEKTRRTSPRFGIGAHGIKGYRLRLVPQKKQVELVKDESEVVATAGFEWKSGIWTHLKLSITDAGGEKWKIEGWAWKDGEKASEKPLIAHAHSGHPGTGKASLWGTPYAGFPIDFDEVKLTVEPK